jgi:hypothetical protein
MKRTVKFAKENPLDAIAATTFKILTCHQEGHEEEAAQQHHPSSL